ncbi:MAG: carboxylating nicotinate-nucleotide diphosphorylase [Candidatus Izemoplasmatales bacterium]
MDPLILTQLIETALLEDMPMGDITSNALFKDETTTARLIAKEKGVLSGIKVAEKTFSLVDSDPRFSPNCRDGDHVEKGTVIATVSGKTRSILMAERVALNFLQRMSGIATLTKAFVSQTAGTKARILDTRKTTPGMRALEKQAVLDGGGTNHRMSLSDMVMIKDNHIQAAGSIVRAVEIIREKYQTNYQIEVEVENIFEFEEAMTTDCDIIMLDNMTLSDMAECVRRNAGKKLLEASGNMTLDRIHDVAKTGVDLISVGQLTHSVKSLDISLKF